MLTVVTGGAGHVGSALVPALVADGHSVRVVDRRGRPAWAATDATWLQADVRDATAMAHALRGADVVYHLAAVISITGEQRGLVRSVNVDGARTVAEAALAAGVSRYVHCSSIHAYDLAACIGTAVNERSPATKAPDRPAYDRSKALGQQTVLELVDRGLDAVCVNPTSIIGAPDPNPSRMGTVLLALWRRRLPATVDGGFDWVDVGDVVKALRSAAEVGRIGQAYLINGHRLSFAALAEAADSITGRVMARRTVPAWLARSITPVGSVLARLSTSGTGLIPTAEALHALRCDPRVDATLARSELGHQPRPIADTLADLHRYFSDHGRLTAS